MPYVQPLSESTLNRRYSALGLSSEQLMEIDTLLRACCNLYGCICIQDVWDVYKEAASKQMMTRFHKKDIVAFADVAMRDASKSYKIYEISDIYADAQSDSLRFVVSKDIIRTGYNKFMHVYYLSDCQASKPFYVPDDIKIWVTPQYMKQAKNLLVYLGKLKVNEKETKVGFFNETTVPCENYGKCLKDFKFIPQINKQVLEYYKQKKKTTSFDKHTMDELLRVDTNNEAEALVKELYNWTDLHRTSDDPSCNIKHLFDELNELGVSLSENEANKLLNFVMDFINNCNLRSNCGWKPTELAKRTNYRGPIHMTIGPGIQQSIKDGTINADELREKMREMGMVPEF